MRRLTSTRWPMSSVGSIEPDGIWYGFTAKAWIPSASAIAAATITTTSMTARPSGLVGGSDQPGSPGVRPRGCRCGRAASR